MRFALTHKILSFALALVAALPLVTSGEIGIGFEIAFFALFAVGWFIDPPMTRRPRYRHLVTALLLAVMAVQLVRLAQGTPMAMLGMEFIALILGAKLSSRGFASDYYQIVIVSFLHIIAATVVINDLLYGVCFVLLVGLSSPVLALSYLRQEMEQRFSPRLDVDQTDMLDRLFRSKRIVSSGFILGSALLSVPILLITVLLFLVFPRFGFGILGHLPGKEAEIGFGESVTLGDFDIVRIEDTVLLRLEPTDDLLPRPLRLPIKLRGAVFDDYNGTTWKRSRATRWQTISATDRAYLLDESARDTSVPGFNVLLEPIEPNLLFLPEGTGVVYTYPVAKRHQLKPRALEANALGEIRYLDDADVGIRYRVGLTGAKPLGAPPGPAQDYLMLPPNSERLMRLAHQLALQGSDREVAQRLVTELKRRYRYSLKLADDERNLSENNPLDRFLFARKSGTCEHFATALTLMLRARGIPARLVTGFSGADWNPIGGFYAVPKRATHSWTEAFIDGAWLSLDATPSSFEPGGYAAPSMYFLFIDTMRMRWHKYIVGYNLGIQGEIAIGVWSFLKRSSLKFTPLPHIPRIVPLFILAALLMGAAAILYHFRRRAPTASSPQTGRKRRIAQKEATRLYEALERRLAKLGHPRPVGCTPMEHLSTLRHADQFPVEVAEQITLRYNEIRFGKTAFRQGESKALLSKIHALGRK